MPEQSPLLPQLRPDLEITLGPADDDGSPTYVIHDPVSNRYFWLGWAEKEIAARLSRPATVEGLITRLKAETTIRPKREEIEEFWSGMTRAGLTMAGLFGRVDALKAQMAKSRSGPGKRLFMKYLYFRLHLIRPDIFLGKVLPFARPLASIWFLFPALICSLLGLYLVSQRWDAFLATFSQVVNFGGLSVFLLSTLFVKVVHELSHAFTAKAAGLRVPSMGVAFILLWPLLYSDVSAAWRLADRKKRIAVSLAGVLAELVIAGLALFGWAVSENGSTWQRVFFILSSSSLLSTFVINLNPAMKFDGYYLFMDLIGVDNLQQRAFSYTRWLYRTRLFGLALPDPEPKIRPRRKTLLLFYTLGAWLYRFFLYIGIATLIYSQFTKALGVVLFSLAIWQLLLRPVWGEIKELFMKLRQAGPSRRAWVTGAVILALLLYLGLPLPRQESFPAIRVPHNDQVIYAPMAGVLSKLAVKREDKVKKGLLISEVISPELDASIKEAGLAANEIEKEQELMRLDPRSKARLAIKKNELDQAKAELARLKKLRAGNRLTADFNGVVYEWDQLLRKGLAVEKDQILGRIAMPGKAKVLAFLPEQWVERLDLGAELTFMPDDLSTARKCRLLTPLPVWVETLAYPSLASTHGGELEAVLDSQGNARLVRSYFVLELSQVADYGIKVLPEQKGRVLVSSKPYSIIADWLGRLKRVLIRESGI